MNFVTAILAFACMIIGCEMYPTLDDGTPYIVHPDQLVAGGPPKDGIPSIDNPRFVPVHQADQWIDDEELVQVIQHNGVDRAYPLQIMVWHEIVNDNIAGDPVLVTYCPLCGSGIAYYREIDGESVEFGVSGKLYNSNLVMYDRATDSYWSQIQGKAIVGEHTGKVLRQIPTNIVSWGDYKQAFPDAEVLDRPGTARNYGVDPYSGYYKSPQIMFPVQHTDTRLDNKEVVFGIRIDETYKAYPEEKLVKHAPFTDVVAGQTLNVERSPIGIVTITDKEGNIVPHERDFWFAWAAFHPETEIYVQKV